MSLLRRLEQGQGGQTASTPAASDADKGSRLGNMQSRRVAVPTGGQHDAYLDLKSRVQNRLLSELDPTTDVTKVNEVRSTIQELFEQILSEESLVLSRPEKARLFEQICAEILGLGPL